MKTGFIFLAACVVTALLALILAKGGPVGQAFALGAVLLAFVASVGRFDLGSLLLGFLVADNLSPFAKRLIFVFGDQPQYVYYAIQALPSIFLILCCALAWKPLLRKKMPVCGWIFAVFLLLSAAVTVVSPVHVAWSVRLAAFQQLLLPMTAFFVGMAVDWSAIPRFGRLFGLLAVVSVAYGLLQFLLGPTLIDHRWAEATYAYSIQGRNVYRHLFGGQGIRVYSYYSDHLTWGLLLLASLTMSRVAYAYRRLKTGQWRVIVTAVLLGAFLTLTRTVWLGLLSTLAITMLLRLKHFRKKWLVWAICVAGFPLGTWFAQTVYDNYFRVLPVLNSPILQRYLTVGTLEARTRGLDLLPAVLGQHALLGRGYGNADGFTRLSETVASGQTNSAHNFVVELAFQGGVVGVSLFFLFFLFWLSQAFEVYRVTPDGPLRTALRWLIGMVIGYLLTGYANGSTFMTTYYFLAMGAVAGLPAIKSTVWRWQSLELSQSEGQLVESLQETSA